MRTNRITGILAAAAVVVVMLTACHGKEVYLEPLDCRYTPAYTTVETEIRHVWIDDDYRPFPYTHSVYHPEQYEILYSITYEDGEVLECWKTVSEKDYRTFLTESGQIVTK